MSIVTRIVLGTSVLEEAMGLPEGVRIVRVEMSQESDAILFWCASEQQARPITAKILSDLGKGFMPETDLKD